MHTRLIQFNFKFTICQNNADAQLAARLVTASKVRCVLKYPRQASLPLVRVQKKGFLFQSHLMVCRRRTPRTNAHLKLLNDTSCGKTFLVLLFDLPQTLNFSVALRCLPKINLYSALITSAPVQRPRRCLRIPSTRSINMCKGLLMGL